MSHRHNYSCDICRLSINRKPGEPPAGWRCLVGTDGHACETCVRALQTVLREAAYKLRNDSFKRRPDDIEAHHKTVGNHEHTNALILAVQPSDLEEGKP